MVYSTVRLLKQVTAFQIPSAKKLTLSAQEAGNELVVRTWITSARDFFLVLSVLHRWVLSHYLVWVMSSITNTASGSLKSLKV